MTTGILVTARLGSSRLKEKHLLKIDGQPIINFLLQRIAREFAPEIQKKKVKILIVTSDRQENRKFEKEITEKVGVFFGSDDNIPLRHFQAGKQYSFSSILAVDGDDILCSFCGMRKIYEKLGEGAPYIATKGLPLGLNSMGYSMEFLGESIKGYETSTLETGWGRIFDQSRLGTLPMPHFSQNNLRFTLDYPEDFDFFRRIVEHFGQAINSVTDEILFSFVIKNKVFKVNEGCSEKFFENFNRGVETEKELLER